MDDLDRPLLVERDPAGIEDGGRDDRVANRRERLGVVLGSLGIAGVDLPRGTLEGGNRVTESVRGLAKILVHNNQTLTR